MAKKKKKKAVKKSKPKAKRAPMLAIPSFKGKYVWVDADDNLWFPGGGDGPGNAYVAPNDIRPGNCPEKYEPAPAQDFLGHFPRFNDEGEWVFEIVWAANAMSLKSALKEHRNAWATTAHDLRKKAVQMAKNAGAVEKVVWAKIRQAEKAALKWGK